MKTLKCFIIISVLATFLPSCNQNFDEINKNPNGPESVPPQLLLPGVQRDVINATLSESWGIGNIVIQHTAKNQFVNEDRYLWGEINGIWNTVYRKMRDLNNILVYADQNNDNAYKGVALVMKSWMMSLVTDAYGDVPYFEAIKAKDGVYYPKYDDQKIIYEGILADLKIANTLLSQASGAIGGDLIFNGDLSKWRKLANSLSVRYLIRISNKVDISAPLKEIVDNPSQFPIFTGNLDNAVYNFLPNAPDQFPLFEARSGSFNEFRASKTLLDTLVNLSDPRLTIFFRATPATEGSQNEQFIGIPNGLDDIESQTYAGGQQNHSRISSLFYEGAISSKGLSVAKGVIMTYAELQFLLAEAAEKNWINGSSKSFYEAGIQSSFQYYGLTLPTGYFEMEKVQLSNSKQENLQKIAVQKWVSLFFQGMEAWFDWRRTKLPVLIPAKANQNNNKIPVRFIYPIIEQALNGPNREAAVARQGGDDINTLMWYLR